MKASAPSLSALPRAVYALLAVYFVASLAHFAHNAEYIALYPNMPGWLTREKVYLAWLAVTGLGLSGLAAIGLRFHLAGVLALSAYGGLGLDGLLHYTLALCSEHTLMTNITIWSEAILGLMLMLVTAVLFGRHISRKWTGYA